MKRLLVIRFGALGDLVHMSASLRTLHAMAPETEIHVLSSAAYASVLARMEGVDRSWAWDKWDGLSALFRLGLNLRKLGFDGVVNLHPSLKTWILTALVAPRQTAVYSKEKLRVKGLLQRRLSRRHAMADFFQPFNVLFPGLAVELLKPVLSLQPLAGGGSADVERPERSPNSFPALPEACWIGLLPGVGGKRSNRAWPPELWTRLMVQLLQHTPTVRILLLGGPDERDLSDSLCQSVSVALDESDVSLGLSARLVNRCGTQDIPGTLGLMAQCSLVVGGDTGPLHVAAALGVPVLGLFGPTSLARTGPVGEGVIAALTPPDALECWPCEQADCPLSGEAYWACMRQISVESVVAQIERLLKR